MNKPKSPHPHLKRAATANLPTEYGDFVIHIFVDESGEEYPVMVMGDVTQPRVLVRLHSQCLTGDVFHSLRCDCRAQLEQAFRVIAKAGTGVIIYLPQEGRGIGLTNKIRAYALQQDQGLDTVDANTSLGLAVDDRQYDGAAEILRDLGIKGVRLLSNNPKKMQGLRDAGVTVVDHVPIEVPATVHSRKYLEVKKTKLGHHLKGV